ncbi:hypothetical protein K6X09_39440 [Burkholderia contaminans]|nr:hypothetical protein [Burkholderia contaminans]
MADLNTLRADLGRVNELLADARAREIATVLAQLKEDVALLKITGQCPTDS